MAIICLGTGKSVPEKKLTNHDLSTMLDTSDEWIRSHTGIGSRYIAEPGNTLREFAVKAALNALASASAAAGREIGPEEIGLVICATATPDFQGFPSTACLVQKKLGAVNAGAFDVSAACSGFIYSLETAAGLMERMGTRYAVVIGAEILSRIIDWNDRSTAVLFGDGAGAVVLENVPEPEKSAPGMAQGREPSGQGTVPLRGIGKTILGSDGDREALYIDDAGHIQMNGRTVYIFAINVIASMTEKLLAAEDISIEKIDFIVCHQANIRILQGAAKKLGIPEEKFVNNMEEYGNTSAASIPITLADLAESGQLRAGMTIMVLGFGAGLTWGGSIIRW
ncbi:MAG: ketoacyl-ACP synthase III [Spirochaetaceae bacterium]|jgi:3-oxoacyl-[acyl-carrier-protein] synthase-3|nr:ketoacyl-ACP synthase III [Spirochaetaceae bacterium]